MSWFAMPDVERREEGEVAVWRLLGDWTRDLPLDIRRAAVAALQAKAVRLVLDLNDVKFIDSWGEETVCDVVQRILDEGGVVAWTRDAARPTEYAGVQRALERRELLRVRSFHDMATAIDTLKSVA